MYSFISLIWNHTDSQKENHATYITEYLTRNIPDFKKAYSTDGMMVFQKQQHKDRMQAYPLRCPGNECTEGECSGVEYAGGVVLGKVFDRPSDIQTIPGNAVLNEAESRKIIQSRGKHLINYYWGRYVAFLKNPKSGRIWVLRDPIGALSCFYTHYKGVHIYFSDMEDMAQLTFLEFTINWNYVASHLTFPYRLRHKTGLNEVSELLAGECLEITRNNISKSYLWDPGQISQTNPLEDPIEAARALHQMTNECVAAWAACYDRIGHRLSGGLDSSIVLASLKKTYKSPEITCFNFFTTAKDGDERLYARLMADQAKVPLIEKERLTTDVKMERLMNIAKSPTPKEYLFTIEQGHIEYKMAKKQDIEAIFSGFGGDQAFLLDCRNLAVSDYLQTHGLCSSLLQIAHQSAQIQDISLWSSLGKALKGSFNRQPWNPYAEYASDNSPVLNTALLKAMYLKNTDPPWLEKADGVPAGKLFHIFLFSLVPNYNGISLRSDFIEPVDPLFSQPLIELCFRIPTWVLQTGGMERGLARLAFKDDVPREIIRRESKGGIMNHINSVFRENAGFISEFLLDGILVEKKFLNRKNLEQALTQSQIHVNSDVTNIMFYMYMEAWLRSWTHRATM